MLPKKPGPSTTLESSQAYLSPFSDKVPPQIGNTLVLSFEPGTVSTFKVQRFPLSWWKKYVSPCFFKLDKKCVSPCFKLFLSVKKATPFTWERHCLPSSDPGLRLYFRENISPQQLRNFARKCSWRLCHLLQRVWSMETELVVRIQ